MANNNTMSEMPFYNISTYQLIDVMRTNGLNVKNDMRENVSFYNNLKSKCNSEILKAVDFSYNTESEFNNLYRSSLNSIELSVFHINIRSLNKNLRGLIELLQTLELDFDVLVLTEIWNYNLEFYTKIFKNYNFHYVTPHESNIDGVGILVKKNYTCNELTDIRIPSTNSTSKVESLWLEISCNRKKYIVGGIYRHPNQQSIKDFTIQLDKSLEYILKFHIPCIIAGDLNVDISKYNTHSETTDYVNNLLINDFIPMIIMPTRITIKSATIIDHIYYHAGSKTTQPPLVVMLSS